MGDFLQITFTGKKFTDEVDYSGRILPFGQSDLVFAPVIGHRCLTNGDVLWDDVKRIYEVEFGIDEWHEFLPGDTIGILPQNDTEEVNQLLTRLNITDIADNEFTLSLVEKTTKKIPKHLPLKASLRQLLLKCIDLRTPPKKMFLKALIKHTTETSEIETLNRLTSPVGSKEYTDFISEKGRTLLKLLSSFKSCKPSIEIILEHSTVLQARPYSISSSPSQKKSINITFFVQENQDKSKGVCTGWLEKIMKNDKVPLYFRKPTDFRLNFDTKEPVLMIGTGTGVAPFIGFLGIQGKQGESWLYQGCRYSQRDAIYSIEIKRCSELGLLNRHILATSRDGPEKHYVQDKIKEDAKKFVDYVANRGARVYICGDPRTVVKDVKEAIVDLLVEQGVCESLEKAQIYLKELEGDRRIVVDSWT